MKSRNAMTDPSKRSMPQDPTSKSEKIGPRKLYSTAFAVKEWVMQSEAA